MEARTALPAPTISYDERAEAYDKHRKIHPGVVAELIDSGLLTATTRVLDVGCGTGNYAAVLSEATGCRMFGIEPSTQMLERARDAAPWEALVQGAAESLPFADDAFDLVMSTDAIHHIGDRAAYFREAARVLHPGGQIVTVTDSHDDIPRRRPLASHFPETITVELDRYPPVPQMLNEMGRAGFTSTCLRQVSHDYELRDIQAYRDRAFSSLLLIDERAFARGIACLEADLTQGPIRCRSLYTLIWGTKPGV